MSGAPTWTYPATVLDVHDGDTVRVDLDLGLHIRRVEPVRVAGIDAPELATASGKMARTFAATLMPAGSRITVVSKQLDKYGRVLGQIALPDGRDLAAVMIAAGHAVPYDGGARG